MFVLLMNSLVLIVGLCGLLVMKPISKACGIFTKVVVQKR